MADTCLEDVNLFDGVVTESCWQSWRTTISLHIRTSNYIVTRRSTQDSQHSFNQNRKTIAQVSHFLRLLFSVSFMSRPSGQSGRRRQGCPFIRQFVPLLPNYYEHDIFKTNEPILTPIGTSSPRGNGVNLSYFG